MVSTAYWLKRHKFKERHIEMNSSKIALDSDTCIRHSEMVTSLTKPAYEILKSLTDYKVALWHATTGIAGESGELLDAIKKVIIYDKPIDLENIIEELGDIEFYMEQLRQVIGVVREETLVHNYNKLKNKRYPDGYSDKAAIARADKPEEHKQSEGMKAAAGLGEIKSTNHTPGSLEWYQFQEDIRAERNRNSGGNL